MWKRGGWNMFEHVSERRWLMFVCVCVCPRGHAAYVMYLTLMTEWEGKVTPLFFCHSPFSDEIEKKLNAYRKGCRIWNMLIFCQVSDVFESFSLKELYTNWLYSTNLSTISVCCFRREYKTRWHIEKKLNILHLSKITSEFFNFL